MRVESCHFCQADLPITDDGVIIGGRSQVQFGSEDAPVFGARYVCSPCGDAHPIV